MPVTLLPDVIKIVRAYLFQHADVNALVGSRVYANASPSGVTYPYVKVSNVVESEVVARVFAYTRVQVEAYGASATDWAGARDLAATCRAALHDLPGWDHPDGWVSHVEEASGVSDVFDTTVDRTRFMFDVRVYARV